MGRALSTNRQINFPSGAGAKFNTATTYTSGSGTYTPPAGTKELFVWVTGAGGGGGKGGGSHNHGGGGASGATVWAHITDIAANYAYSIGGGGAGQTGPDHAGGSAGAQTTFGNITANAGEGAKPHDAGNGDRGVAGTVLAYGSVGSGISTHIIFRGGYSTACGGGSQDTDRPGSGDHGQASFWGNGGYSGNHIWKNGNTAYVFGAGGGGGIHNGSSGNGAPGCGGLVYVEAYT